MWTSLCGQASIANKHAYTILHAPPMSTTFPVRPAKRERVLVWPHGRTCYAHLAEVCSEALPCEGGGFPSNNGNMQASMATFSPAR